MAVRIAIEYHIVALPRTPFPAARAFPSRGNERYEEKNRGVICCSRWLIDVMLIMPYDTESQIP